jgi:hypothetical protein
MSAGRDDLELQLPAARMPIAALGSIVLAACCLWGFCLPDPPRLGAAEHYDQVYFRPEWLVLATLLAVPLSQVARWRVSIAALVCALLSGVALVVAVEGGSRIRAAGYDGPVALVVAAAAVQCLVFATAVICGSRARLFERRWARLQRRMAALDPQPSATRSRSDDVRRRP